ncbi:hypothetical protein, partial [Methylobrevis pamukkalensis]|uniref:hypothetical protein n=1 Tax=Methylobrevis pamukkalensis TaxID=1439726 RepID=UPI001AEC9F58
MKPLSVDSEHLDIRRGALADVFAERADSLDHALGRRRLDGAFPVDVVVLDENHILTVAALEQAAFDQTLRVKPEFQQKTSADLVLDTVVELNKLGEYRAKVIMRDLPERAQ